MQKQNRKKIILTTSSDIIIIFYVIIIGFKLWLIIIGGRAYMFGTGRARFCNGFVVSLVVSFVVGHRK